MTPYPESFNLSRRASDMGPVANDGDGRGAVDSETDQRGDWCIKIGVQIGLAHGQRDVEGPVNGVGTNLVIDHKDEGCARRETGFIQLGCGQHLEWYQRHGVREPAGRPAGIHASPGGRINPLVLMGRLGFGVAVALVLSLPSKAAVKPLVQASTVTTNVPIIQNLKFQTHPLVPTTNDDVSGRLLLATKALEVKDSPTDVACPVKMSLAGNVSSFTSSGNYLFSIGSSQDIADLLAAVDLDTKGVVVGQIQYCNGPTIAFGCTLPGILMIFSDDPSATWDDVTAAHEFGHYQGLNDVNDPKRIMDATEDSGPENEVTAGECHAFEKPLQ